MTGNYSGMAAGLAEGSRLAGYLIEQQIGAGGMAVVYRAYDQRLQRPVALKVMSAAVAADEAFRRRFILESQAAAAVDDPHIIPVYEAGEANGTLFIAMRYVAGGDAHSLVRRTGPLPVGRAVAIISAVATALDAAHAAGLVHRDVKPANMLLDVRPGRPDHVYLSDFGLSKATRAVRGLTASGQFLGTPDYTAPEQMQAMPTDGRADQYALACAAFELLSGAPPFPRDQVTAVIWAHMSEPPPSLASRRSGVPADADPVLRRALAKRPEDRYPTCRAFADALRSVLAVSPVPSGSGPTGSSGHAAARPEPAPGRRKILLAGASAAAVLAAGGGVWELGRHGSGRPPASRKGAQASHGATRPAAAGPSGPGSVIWTQPVTSSSTPWLRVIPGGDVIYLQGETELAALRARDGRELWSFSPYGDSRVIASVAATPDSVYVAVVTSSGGQLGVHAFDAARKALFTLPLLAEGLTVAGGRLYACGELRGQPGLYALNGRRGRRIWTFATAVIGTPAVSGGVVYALGPGAGSASQSTRLYAVAAATGRQLWSRPADWSDKPVLANGGSVCVVSQASDTLWVWDARTGALAWRTDTGGGIAGASLSDGVVYAVTKNGQLLALDATARKRLWQQPTSTLITPAVAGGVVYAGSTDDGLVARRASDGRELWRSSAGYLTAGPAVANGVVYAASSGSVYALRA